MADTNGAVVPSTTDEGAPTIPGRAEVLRQFAGEVLDASRPPESKASDGAAELPAEAGKTAEVLSKTVEKSTETPKAPAAEPAWNAEQSAWFDQMNAAQTDAERTALQASAPAFSEAEIAWLKSQEQSAAPAAAALEDHLAEDAELKGKLDAATQERINKRIGKEVAKTKEAKEQLEQAAAKLAEAERQLSQRPNSPNAQTGPMARIETREQVQQAETEARAALEQAEDLLAQLDDDVDGVEAALKASRVVLKSADGTEDYSAGAMRKMLKQVQRNAQHTLTRDLPQRVAFLKQVDASAGEAIKIMPELKDLKSPRRAQFDTVVKQFPQVKSFPNWPSALALMLIGQETLAQRQAAAAPAAKPKRPVPVVIPSARGAVPVAPRARAAGLTQEVAEAALSGDRKARLQYLQQFVPKMG